MGRSLLNSFKFSKPKLEDPGPPCNNRSAGLLPVPLIRYQTLPPFTFTYPSLIFEVFEIQPDNRVYFYFHSKQFFYFCVVNYDTFLNKSL